VYTLGRFIDTVDFDPDSGIYNLQTAAGAADDIFVQKLSQCWIPPTVLQMSLCQGDSLRVGNSTYMESGNYRDVLLTSTGCDSAIFSNLQIVEIDLSFDTTTQASVLKANQSGASYQWLDCGNGYAPLSGDTSQTLIVPASGDYAVEISLHGCVDTTACINSTLVGLNGLSQPANVRIYPNPAKGAVHLQLPSEGKVEIYTHNGQLLWSRQYPQGRSLISTADMAAGIYFLRHSTENGSSMQLLLLVE
jgi:hypothetical protein